MLATALSAPRFMEAGVEEKLPKARWGGSGWAGNGSWAQAACGRTQRSRNNEDEANSPAQEQEQLWN